jgi:hypothetical protein
VETHAHGHGHGVNQEAQGRIMRCGWASTAAMAHHALLPGHAGRGSERASGGFCQPAVILRDDDDLPRPFSSSSPRTRGGPQPEPAPISFSVVAPIIWTWPAAAAAASGFSLHYSSAQQAGVSFQIPVVGNSDPRPCRSIANRPNKRRRLYQLCYRC